MLVTPPKPLQRLDVVLLVAVFLIAVSARLLPGPRTIDDAFITFRYSRNLLDGNGFVYNLDSRVMGTTTPLFTLLMAGIGGILNGRDFQTYAIGVSALADGITAVLLALIMRRVTANRWSGILLGLLWAVAPASVTFAVGGMETSITILWMIAAVWCYLTDRPLLLGLFTGLGFLTRIDSVLWSGPLLLHQLWVSLRVAPRRLPLRTWAAGSVIVVPWLIFSLTYFGTIIPRSVLAKVDVYRLPPGAAFQTLLQNYSTPFFENVLFGSAGVLIAFLAYAILGAVGFLYASRSEPRLLPLLLYPYLYLIVFSIANPLIFRWYTAPPMPAWFLVLLCGTWAIISQIKPKRAQTRRAVQLGGLGAVGLLFLVMSLSGWTLHPDHAPDRPAPMMAWHLIELDYRLMADDLVQNYGVGPKTKVAVGDIGVVGYYTNAQIIDTIGLVTPAMSKYYPADPALNAPGQNYAVPPAIIHDTQPDFIVLMEAFVRNGLERDPQFKADYELIRTIPTDFYGTGMLLYKRR